MQVLSDRIGNHEIAKITYECDSCGEEFIATITRISETELDVANTIIGVRKSENNFKDRYIFRCLECYEKDQNFGTECDIYSRVVGFMRPLKYWNNAKMEEFKKRKLYFIPSDEELKK